MAGFYENAGDPGNQFGTSAQASATEAKHWANYFEDVVVPEDGAEYSAKHYAAKSSDFADASEASKIAAALSETAAGDSETNAAASEAAAELALDNFTDLYLGAKASDPTLDNDGDALQDGALYFNTTGNFVKVYDLGTTSWGSVGSYTHPNHSGDVTSVGDGATTIVANAVTTTKINNSAITEDKLGTNAVTAAKISDEAVTNAKLEHIPTSRIKGRASSGTGVVEDLTATQVRSMLNVENGATADQTKADIDALGIDAATLDGIDSTDFLRTDTTGNKSVGGNPYLPQTSLTDAATITWDALENPIVFVTLGGNRTIELVAMPPNGTWLTLVPKQDGTGSRTLSYSSDFGFGAEGTPVLTANANQRDVLSFYVTGNKALFMGIKQGFGL